MKQYSLNNRLVVQSHKTDKSLRSNVSNGFASIAQKTGLVGLTVLMDAMLRDYGTISVDSAVSPIVVRAGSTAYIREEILHTAPWAQKALSCDTIDVPFWVVELSNVEFITPPPEKTAA